MRTIESHEDLMGGMSRVFSIVGTLGLIVGLGGFASRPVRAEIQNDTIGFSPNHVFESGDAGEHIDVLSGNMSLTIPIGPRFRLTDDFSWGLTLRYNSKIWEHVCEVPLPSNTLCTGTLSDYYSYGRGFSMSPGRVYHNPHDYPSVYRVQLEDGSEHMFCDADASPAPLSTVNCPAVVLALLPGPPVASVHTFVTTDASRIQMYRYTTPTDGNGWKAITRDGRTITFKAISATEALATLVATTALRPDGMPRAWIDYSVPDRITDSQGRLIWFEFNDLTDIHKIHVPPHMDPVTSEWIEPIYELKTFLRGFKDPTDPGTVTNPTILATLNKSGIFLESIRFPGLNAETESYRFRYSEEGRTGTEEGPTSFGWMTQRTLPTGAVINYYYDTYPTSERRPYHVELTRKELKHTVGTQPKTFNWNWSRWSIAPQEPLPSFDPQHPNAGTHFLGSNPHTVAARDPFNNLTLYKFLATTSNLQTTGHQCNGQGECSNKWSDGMLSSVSTYAGPNPDSEQLVRQVNYLWDSDRADLDQSTHKMFQYRLPVGPAIPPNNDGPRDVNTVAVNVRQIEETTFIPPAQGGVGRTVRVDSSEWYTDGVGCPEARKKHEYVDGAFYRSTYTDTYMDAVPSARNCAAHRYVEVKDPLEHVVSRVDRVFTNGQLQCEVRRTGAGPFTVLPNCTNLSLGLGDVATLNTFDDQSNPPPTATGAVISTRAQGGDLSTTDSRTITMDYLTALSDGAPNTPYLKTKNYGFDWKAVDRTVDFQTGWTTQTKDPAGNATNYSWDALGRLTRITPCCANSPEKPTTIAYPSIHETSVRQDLSSGNFVETVYLYDDLGRLVTTKRRNAIGTRDVQHTEYDIAGRVTRKSEWASEATAPANLKWTTYDYTIYTELDPPSGEDGRHPDPLGRIHGVTTPDDPTPETPTTETTYSGNQTTVTVRDIRGLAENSDASITSTTVYTKDALGRLISVDAPGAGVDAQYAYDEADNLTEVRLTDPATPSHVQVRYFEYDRLGRLRTASNPESGTVEYLSYDARGNLLAYKDARQTIFKMSYDAADRQLTRTQTMGGSDLPLLQNTYDGLLGVNTGGSAGRLVQQQSHKIENGTSAQVSTVRFGYGLQHNSAACPVASSGYTGLNGRLSWQTSSIQPWGMELRTELPPIRWTV